jgi:hypothetical protein
MKRTPFSLVLAALTLAAGEAPKQPWSDKASLSVVSVSGNAQGQTLKDHSAYLAVWKNAFTTSLARRLALKVGYDCTYNNAPAFLAVDILQAGSAPPVVLGQAPVRLRNLDTVFTTSLVVSL